MGKFVARVATVGLFVGAGYFAATHDPFACAISAVGKGDVGACFSGGTSATGSMEAPTKYREFVDNTVQVHVLGQVVMKLKGNATVVMTNTGWNGIWNGGGSDLYWNRGNAGEVTAVYNPCFGTALTGDKQTNSASPTGNANKYPLSTFNPIIKADGPDKLSVTVNTGAMGICFTRVSNAEDEPGGLENEKLWTNDDGSLFKTNSDTGARDKIGAAVKADVNKVVRAAVDAQACPETALSGSMSQDDIKRAMAKTILGGLLEKYGGDKDVAHGLSDAFADQFVSKTRQSFTINMAPPQDRINKNDQALSGVIAGLVGKEIHPEGAESTFYKWTEIKKPVRVSCGTGTITAP